MNKKLLGVAFLGGLFILAAAEMIGYEIFYLAAVSVLLGVILVGVFEKPVEGLIPF